MALHIAAQLEEMAVLCHGKRFEPPLVEVPRAHVVVMSVPALRVRQRQPVAEPSFFPPTNYTYDPAGQLLTAGSGTYSYDGTGNRTNPGYQTGPGNQLLSDGTYNYTYDAEGNEITKTNIASGDQWTYGYDNLNGTCLPPRRVTSNTPPPKKSPRSLTSSVE